MNKLYRSALRLSEQVKAKRLVAEPSDYHADKTALGVSRAKRVDCGFVERRLICEESGSPGGA